MIVGCSNPEVNQKKDSQSEDVAIDLSDVDTNLVPSLNEVIKETDKKKELFPDAYKKSWLITEMQKDFEFVGAGNQSITEMAKNYKNAVTTGILLKLAKRSIDYEAIKKDKYADLSCDIDFTGIIKGDILLTLTRNPTLMACDGENTSHHALLCITDPTSDDSNVSA